MLKFNESSTNGLPKKDVEEKEDYRYREHNPSEQPLSGLESEGWDVVDPEQYYNLPDFEEYKKSYEVVAEEEPDLETAELLAKYDFDELDLKMKAEAAHNFLRGRGRAPFQDMNKNRELAAWQENYLTSSNQYGLPFNEVELRRISDKEKEQLSSLYQERFELQEEVATAQEKNTKLATSHLTKHFYKLNAEISAIENKLLTNTSKQDRREQMLQETKFEKEIPKYSAAEIELQEACLNFLSIRQDRRERKPRPSFVDGQVMKGEQILEVAQEGAREKIKTGEMMQGVFFEESYRGQRQLACVQKNGNKRIKYILVSPILPAGHYAFTMDLDSMFTTPKDLNSAFAQVNLMVSLENPKEVMKVIMENKNKNFSRKNNNRQASA